MPLNLPLVHNFKLENQVELRHYFPIFSQTLLSLSRWENQASKMLHENLNAVPHFTSSLILTNHWKILKTPQDGFFKGIFSSAPTDGTQKKLIWKFWQWWKSNIYLKFLFLSSSGPAPWQYFIIQWPNLTEML